MKMPANALLIPVVKCMPFCLIQCSKQIKAGSLPPNVLRGLLSLIDFIVAIQLEKISSGAAFLLYRVKTLTFTPTCSPSLH